MKISGVSNDVVVATAVVDADHVVIVPAVDYDVAFDVVAVAAVDDVVAFDVAVEADDVVVFLVDNNVLFFLWPTLYTQVCHKSGRVCTTTDYGPGATDV